MSTIAEIESAIEKLPVNQVDELVSWLEKFRFSRSAHTDVETWLTRARGAGRPGVTTDEIMQATRGES